MNKICGIYKITNTITGDFYIGSSKNVKRRWVYHKIQSTWSRYPNYPLYQDMQKFGVNSFVFEILAEVEPDNLKETEQQFIETLKPTYNDRKAKGWDIERYKEYKKSSKGRESHRKANNKYYNQLCFYNSETLTLDALRKRFWRKGISNPTAEAKKYIIKEPKTPIEF